MKFSPPINHFSICGISPVELTSRDRAILETVGELGTADTELLHLQFFPNDNTGRACQERLRKLVEAGLLFRKRITEDDESARVLSLYFLTSEGAELVAGETGVHPRRVSTSDPKPFTLRHRITTVRARMAIDEAARLAGLPPVEWIMEQDTDPNVRRSATRSPTEYLVLNDSFEHGRRRVAFRPDASFHLQVSRPSGAGYKSLLGYVEVDRSTEGHKQWGSERKLLGIEAFIAAPQAWRRHWPNVADPTVIVFVLCLSQQRAANLVETIKPSSAAKQIRFTTLPLHPATILTADVWMDCQGELKRIIRTPGVPSTAS